ncbi:hypothetical protein DFH29DRAFT_998570 [Suillus ampliporus]|nr:hypothetical protein DFH29DRAFT_998570 [Suillus ampliporus]
MPRSNSSVDSPEKTKQKLTEEEVLVLKPHLEEWKEAAAEDRKKILRVVYEEAKVHAPTMDAMVIEGKEIGARPGTEEFLKRYHPSLNAVMASLSKEELKEAEKTAMEWSSEAPPTGVQAEFAQKKAPGMMKDLATQLWRQASMRIFILSAWKTEEGEVRINGIDFNEKLEGNSFTDTKDWKPMLSEWNAYAGEEFGVDQNDDDDDQGEGKKSRKRRGKKEEYPLEVDGYGLPVIPDASGLDLDSKKHLIRTFLTKHYRFCSQRPKGSVPWSTVIEAQDDYIEAKFLPTGGKFKEPSKIRLAEADQLLQFWHQRQKDKVRPTFAFKAWEDHDGKKREPVETISGEDSDTRLGRLTAETRVPLKGQLKSQAGGWNRSQVLRMSMMMTERKRKETRKMLSHPHLQSPNEPKSGAGLKSKPVPSPKSKPTNKRGRVGLVESGSDQEEEDSRLPVKKSKPVAPPKSKPIKKRGRVGPVESGSDQEEEDSRLPAKKSKPVAPPKSKLTKKRGTVGPVESGSDQEEEDSHHRSRNPSQLLGAMDHQKTTPVPVSVQSPGNHLSDPLTSHHASKSRSFGPTSGVQTKKNQKAPVPKPTPPAKVTGNQTQGQEAPITNPEPKCSNRTAKASYKAHYMQK